VSTSGGWPSPGHDPGLTDDNETQAGLELIKQRGYRVRSISGERLGCLAAFFLLCLSFLAIQPWNTLVGHASVLGVQRLSTPELIEDALQQGKISQETADLYLAYALTGAGKLPQDYVSSVPWEGTLYLQKLQNNLRSVNSNSPGTEAIQAILSSICSYSNAELPNRFLSEHFSIEYNTVGGELELSDYIYSLEVSWIKQIDQFGWAAPPVYLSNPAPENHYPVHITTLHYGLYGFVSVYGHHAGFVGDNPNTPWNDEDAFASCMVLNRDYSNFPGTSQTALDATAAHEFNHAIQYGLGALNGFNLPDSVFIEAGATWMEDETFDDANDNYNYLWPVFSSCMGNYNYSPYAYWITFRGMLEPLGTGVGGGGEDILQAFWELTSQNLASNLGALSQAIQQHGGTLADVYHQYAIAVKFNHPCQGGYVRPFCLEEGPEYVVAAGPTNVHGIIAGVGSGYSGSVQDNYAINWVRLPENSGVYDISMRNTSTGGALRSSVVCDTGTSLRVQPMVSPLGAIVYAGGEVTRANFNSTGCNSVVLVLTNQAVTAENPSSCIARSYQILTTSRIAPTPTPASIFYFPWVPISN